MSARAYRWPGVLACLLFAAAADAETHVVTIHRMSYELPAKEIRVGDIIEWVNEDAVPHTATSDSAGFDATVAAGEAARTTLTRAGRFEVICRYHVGMRAVLVVR